MFIKNWSFFPLIPFKGDGAQARHGEGGCEGNRGLEKYLRKKRRRQAVEVSVGPKM